MQNSFFLIVRVMIANAFVALFTGFFKAKEYINICISTRCINIFFGTIITQLIPPSIDIFFSHMPSRTQFYRLR